MSKGSASLPNTAFSPDKDLENSLDLFITPPNPATKAPSPTTKIPTPEDIRA